MSQALQVALNMTSGTIRAACAALERRPTDPQRLATVLGILRDTADELGAIGRMQQRLAQVLDDELPRLAPVTAGRCPECNGALWHRAGCSLDGVLKRDAAAAPTPGEWRPQYHGDPYGADATMRWRLEFCPEGRGSAIGAELWCVVRGEVVAWDTHEGADQAARLLNAYQARPAMVVRS